MFGVGIEIILTGIYLKIKPMVFIKYMDANNDKTPSFRESRKFLLDDLSDEIPKDQERLLHAMFRYIHGLRNNQVHLAFHHEEPAYFRRLTLEIGCESLMHYSETDLPELDSIRSEFEKEAERRAEGISSDLDFSIPI